MTSRRERGISASWDNNDVMIFCDICIREIQLGNRPSTHFNKEGWKNIITSFHAQSGKLYDRAQLKNKWDMLKKEWKTWRELKRGETGLGWNPVKKTIDASDEWWIEKIAAIPLAKKFRYAGIQPELEEKLDQMFSTVVAVGEGVFMPNAGRMPTAGLSEQKSSDDEDVMVTDSTSQAGMSERHTLGESSSQQSKRVSSRGGKMKNTNKSQLIGFVRDLVTTAHEIAPVNKSTTIKEAYEAIAQIPEIYEDLDFYNYATEFVLDKNRREGFMNCPSERKVWWLRTRYEKRFEF